jgi:iron complex transport system ATP-binding protein
MMVGARDLALPGRLQATSLTLRAGELTCLIGPNGSGKTSLLHALAGIGSPGGRVRIDGMDPAVLPPPQRQRLLAYLPASRDITWPLTAADLIALGADKNPEAIEQALEDLDLRAFADRRVDRLSTGERSRVLIARVLAARPKLLLLDEPVANLDPLWQLRLLDHLRRLARNGGQALLVAMHDLELTRLYADRLIIMERGSIAADGETQALLEGPHIPAVFGIEKAGGRWQPTA